VAIIGMRGRFPGAKDLDELWSNFANGVESIATLSPEEMRAAGVPDHISKLPGYVNASPVLDNVDEFDAEFFGFSARDAALTDPQHRLFIETCWEALEDSGYDPASFKGEIGLFGGCEMSTYLNQLYQNPDALQYIDGMQLMVTNDKDHLCTQTSYRLNLRGPSIVVQTTCSTSLVAVSMACESLFSGRCQMALAGGATVRVPQRGGYFYTPGSILSPDGHCRPFDAAAQGTIVGSGVGIVVLKKLKDAIRDRDQIRAVILGAGVNNDGNDKVGYTAPSFRGQAAAIRAAHRMAGVTPDSIGYVEAHGTGTILGDPIEISALTEVFANGTEKRGYCGIGSAKSNFGHLSCAAGVAGLIKTTLMFDKGAIPPTVHYKSPNPAIDFIASPFFVTNSLHPWTRNGHPRRAGVSSFGVGGTNAHLVIEEAPDRAALTERRSHQLLTISARSDTALASASQRLAEHLRSHPEIDLADAAHTLHVGRHAFRQRRTIVAPSDDRDAAIRALLDASNVTTAGERSIVFMFPGQGAQYPGMAQGLYKHEPVVRRAIDQCAKILDPELGADLRKVLFPSAKKKAGAADVLRDTKWAQPALFTIGYALAELWMSWGVKPSAMIGHSVGEYVAATLAGVMSLEDALRLIARRGQLISALPRGSMLAVMSAPDALERYLSDGVSIAAINAPGFAVLSGPDAEIDRVATALDTASIVARRLHTSHAFHSSMMDPILGEFESLVAKTPLSPPSIPFATTLTGNWANGDVIQPNYWSAQIRSTVRFADAVRTVQANAGAERIFLEVGPGNTLATFASDRTRGTGTTLSLTSLPTANDPRVDTEVMLGSLGTLWSHGVSVDWSGFHKHERRTRVSLPTYPFERRSYWIGPKAASTQRKKAYEARDVSNWFHKPVWREASPMATGRELAGQRVLVFDEGTGVGAAVVERVRDNGGEPISVKLGESFARFDDHNFQIDAASIDDFTQLAALVTAAGLSKLGGVIDCWSAAPPANTDLDFAAKVTLLAPMRFVHALSAHSTVRPLVLLMVARGATRVNAGDVVDPPRALGIGSAKVIPQEHPGTRVAHVDVDDDPRTPTLILDEFAAGATEPNVALRGGGRYVEIYEPLVINDTNPARNLPERPVVLVTGGLGHMGMHLAEGLFDHVDARLVLLGRTTLPPPEQWEAASKDSATPAETRTLLERLATMRRERDDVMVLRADLNDRQAVKKAVDEAIARFGHIDMLIHGAARIDAGAFASAAETGLDVVDAQFSPKLRGLHNVIEAFRGREPGRWVLHSSISAVLGGLGLAAYSAANMVLDAMALAGGPRWLAIGWDLWENAAEAHIAGMPSPIHAAEGVDSLLRILGVDAGERVLVAVNDLAGRLKAWVRTAESSAKNVVERHPRPNLSTGYVEPRSATERDLAEIWGAQLGVDKVGIHDRFFDLGGHSLLAVQVSSEIRDKFQIELPVLRLFQAPSVAELAVVIDQAKAGTGDNKAAGLPSLAVPAIVQATKLEGEAPEAAAKQSYREFYDDVTRKLEQSGVAEASFFLNYGYKPLGGSNDEAVLQVPDRTFNANSVRLAFEVIGPTDIRSHRVLDVGSGRGGNVALMADRFEANVTGVDLSPEAIAFCRKTHLNPRVAFEVGDAEHLPCENASFDFVTNFESSHTYPNLRNFYAEVARVLKKGGKFLYTDLLPVTRWLEVRALLAPLGLSIESDREITPNVLASCDEVAATRAQAFGGSTQAVDNFLAVPGSMVYEQMKSGNWEYRVLRAKRL
jgi:acyl transferase domain-containing protein/SAM-dependent methyltransferase/acyl carrier protein